jgi:signal peptidase I
MADNRNAGEDSRHWGPLARDRIVGRPVWIYWSSDAKGHTRWDRVGIRIR